MPLNSYSPNCLSRFPIKYIYIYIYNHSFPAINIKEPFRERGLCVISFLKILISNITLYILGKPHFNKSKKILSQGRKTIHFYLDEFNYVS